MEIQEDKRALRRGQLEREKNRGEKRNLLPHKPQRLKAFVSQRAKRIGAHPERAGMSPGGEGQHHPRTALAGCWYWGTDISWGKTLNEEEEVDSSLMDGEDRRLQQHLSSSSSFPFGLGSLGRILAQNRTWGHWDAPSSCLSLSTAGWLQSLLLWGETEQWPHGWGGDGGEGGDGRDGRNGKDVDVLCWGTAPPDNAKFGLMDWEQMRLRGHRAQPSR